MSWSIPFWVTGPVAIAVIEQSRVTGMDAPIGLIIRAYLHSALGAVVPVALKEH
jgi:hypothetical protein